MSARSACAVLTLGLIVSLPQLHAQTVVAGRAPAVRRQLPQIWIGSGIAAGSGSASSESLATQSGGLFMAAIELPMRQSLGRASIAVRAEGRWSQQSLDTDIGNAMSGEVQTVSAGLTMRLSPSASRIGEPSRVTPYALAGAGVARPSTRVVVSVSNPDMPSARFGQTSSEIAPTGVGGLGALLRLGRAQLFAEARTEVLRRDAGTMHTAFGTVGVAFRTHR